MDFHKLDDNKIFYGSHNNKNIYKIFWIMIIKYLPEDKWFIIKRLSKSFYNLIKKYVLNDDIKTMALKN